MIVFSVSPMGLMNVLSILVIEHSKDGPCTRHGIFVSTCARGAGPVAVGLDLNQSYVHFSRMLNEKMWKHIKITTTKSVSNQSQIF